MRQRRTAIAVLIVWSAYLVAATHAPAAPNEPVELIEPLALEQIVRFSFDDSNLLLHTQVQPTSGMSIVSVPDLPGTTRLDVRLRSRRDRPGMGLFFRLMHSAPAPATAAATTDESSVQTNIYSRPGYLELSRIARRNGVLETVTLTQLPDGRTSDLQARPDEVTLKVRRLDITSSQVLEDSTRYAATVIDLIRRHPRAAAEHLGPIFRMFGQEQQILGADLGLAWQVFAPEIPPDDALAPRVAELVALFNADDFRVRERAFDDLKSLGGPAALVLMRSRHSGLTTEQLSKIGAFLQAYNPLTPEEAADRLGDRDFLLNCVAYSDSPLIRQAAADRLEDDLTRAREAAASEKVIDRIEIVAELRRELPSAADAEAMTE